MTKNNRITGLGKRIASVAGATALLVGGAVATAGPAAAGPNCASGYHCVFISSIENNVKHSYFSSDSDFTNDTFDGAPADVKVNDYVEAASNSSNSGYESHYYYDINYGGGLVFCVNPGSSVDLWSLTEDGYSGNGKGQRNEASSLRVRSTTTIPCF
ncbi:hypothetical protein [Streptomyces vietnamensis]|uniref:Peptidase inhibitor family I36 n=1 Tax=Streptomyces vietnamensis TaxID=362257 RepID=A0A0B5HS94_9ACTN|nr:hypothetical protein [Streptomyces vietnamensis]AJF64940.1 hypothetical protein SVTN_11390 [Streptomyces vietnamensis]